MEFKYYLILFLKIKKIKWILQISSYTWPVSVARLAMLNNHLYICYNSFGIFWFVNIKISYWKTWSNWGKSVIFWYKNDQLNNLFTSIFRICFGMFLEHLRTHWLLRVKWVGQIRQKHQHDYLLVIEFLITYCTQFHY